MQFKYVLAPGKTVKTVHILCDQGEFRNPVFHFYESIMTGIWPHTFDRLPAPGIPIPDEFGIAGKGFRGG